MKKTFKNVNDVVLACLMIVVGLFLLFGKITEQAVTTGQGGFLARSDVWLRMMAVFMIVVSVILIIRSINFKGEEDCKGFSFYLDSTVIATVVSLIVYTIALPQLGFFFSTYVMCFYLVLLYSIKEKAWSFTTVPKGNWGKLLLKAVIVAAVLLVIFWFVFGKLLAIQLPEFELLYTLGIK